MKQLFIRLSQLLTCIFLANTARAGDYIPPMPADLSQVDIYLQTVGRGSELYMVGGHSILRVVDHLARTDVVFNYGVFDFNDEGFFLKFLRGNINYRMSAYSMRDNLAMYRYEKRQVNEERVNFTMRQKEAFMRAVIASAQPENLFFRYHYYFTNCSTKALDMIDAGVGGKIKEMFANQEADETLRDAVRHSFNYYPFVQMALEIWMNGDLDKKMTLLQDTFLPVRLQRRLQTVPQFDDSGTPVPNTKLLTNNTVILEYAEPKPASYTGSQILLVLLAPLLIFAMSYLYKHPFSKPMYRFAGSIAVFWGLFSTFFGVTMVVIWFATEHVHGAHSANLWLFWPIDFIWIYLGAIWMRRGRSHAPKHVNLIKVWLSAHVILLAAAALLVWAGIIEQDVSRTWAHLGPVMLLMSVFTLVFGIRKSIAGDLSSA